jgi:Spy/CpxP family protein refolding chaperone
MRAISLAIPLAIGGLLFAQTSAPASSPATTPQAHHHARRGMMGRLTAELNLTPDQQTKAHAIFQKARSERKALWPQLRIEREAMLNAVKSDNTAKIDSLSRQNAELNAKVRAIHERSIAEFHAILNSDQKAKFDRRLDAMFGQDRMQARRHHVQGQNGTQN